MQEVNLTIEEKSIDTSKKIVGVQIPITLYEELKDEANKRFISISDIIRTLIYKWLNSNQKEF